jgi:hypothetical protein
MIRNFKILIFITLLFAILSIYSCSTGSKRLPASIYPVNITDGEFLHYGDYIDGSKDMDYYQVTRKVTNGNGSYYYSLYFDMIPVRGGKKLRLNYTSWPVITLFDPVRGLTLESEANLNTNDMKNWAKFGFSGFFHSHYKLYPDKGYVSFISKSFEGNEIVTKTFRINIRPGFPVVDMFSLSQYAGRFFDPRNHGILYILIPNFLKDPIPVSFDYGSIETISTKAGAFRVKKIKSSWGDAFIGNLLDSFSKNLSIYVEDSDRRIAVKKVYPGGEEIILENISNIFKK